MIVKFPNSISTNSVEEGADVNKASKNGFTPVYIAAGHGQTETVEMLLPGQMDFVK